jgi:GH24 family phage-related lysozyme (muramidase)
MQAYDEKKTNGRWKVAYVEPQQVSKSQHTFIVRGQLRKQIEEEAKTPKEKEDLIKGYEKAKLQEVSAYIARVMRKNQHKDCIKFAYNFE